jgi:hypothetical protein
MGSDRYCFASRGGILLLPVETARQEFVRASMRLWLVSDLAHGWPVSGVAEGPMLYGSKGVYRYIA